MRRGRPAAQSESPPQPRIKRPSSTSEAYFRSEGAHQGPLVVVYHIQKTAGTALRQVVRANLPPAELEIAPDLRDLRYAPAELLSWHRNWYRSLDADRRARLSCVMGHSAGYLLPALEQRAETLVLVREPVDRVLSFYWEKRRNFLRGRDPETPFNLLEKAYAPPGPKGPPQSWPQFFNWQSRCLLSVFHDISGLSVGAGPPPDADLWRSRLHELVEGVFYVGVQDRFASYVESLSRRFGWNGFVPQSGVNTERPPLSEAAPDLREMILAYNWLDSELYRLCRDVQERRESEQPGAARPARA